MPNDVITLNALRSELNTLLQNARIDKIFMPEKDELTFNFRANSENFRLVISCNSQNPRIHTTKQKKENPVTAPAFCMLARKHIQNGIIKGVSLFNNDRIFDIEVSARNEMNDLVSFRLLFEFMGRYSNIIFCNGDYKIIDAIKRVSFDASATRCILPGATYLPPSYTKIPHNDKSALIEFFKTLDASLPFEKQIYENIAGIAPETAKIILKYSNFTKVDEESVLKLADSFILFSEISQSEVYSPCVCEGGKGFDYYVYPPSTDCEKYPTLLDCAEVCLATKDNQNRHRERSKSLDSAVKKLIKRNKNTLSRAYSKLEECDKIDYYKKCGELITNNIYKIKKGEKTFKTIDYYEENCPEISITLNELFSPGQNAQAYFKKYAKLKRTLIQLEKQIEETADFLEYLASVEAGIATCKTSDEFAEIEFELQKVGGLPKSKSKRKLKPSSMHEYIIDGFTFLVGKNNIQNDNLTFKLAKNNDLWFHVKNTHGSHGVLLTGVETVSDEVKQTCCEIVAFYSKASQSDKTECDYTLNKFVKRHPRGELGMTTYTNQKTFLVAPCEHHDLKKN